MKPAAYERLEQFDALAGEVAAGTHPIMPKPEWQQDVAMVAFFIDRQRDMLWWLAEDMAALCGGEPEMWLQRARENAPHPPRKAVHNRDFQASDGGL